MVSSALFYWIAMNSRVLRTVATFEKPHPVLLGFLPGDYQLHKIP